MDLFCSDSSSFWCMAPKYVTNQSDARILVCDLLLCTNPSTWLTPQQPFDCCSWFAAASHRNTNKIFNVDARDFALLQNPKAYKKRSKNTFFYRRRLGFQKENLMKLCRVRFFFKRSLILGTMWNWDENWKYSQVFFWISLHQGTLSVLCFRIQGYMFSLMNEVDSCVASIVGFVWDTKPIFPTRT